VQTQSDTPTQTPHDVPPEAPTDASSEVLCALADGTELTRREVAFRRAPFAIVAFTGQLLAFWPPGPTNMTEFYASTVLLLVCVFVVLRTNGVPPHDWLVRGGLYITSVTLLMLATGGVGSGLGALLLVPVVGIALYGKPRETAVTVGFVLLSILVVSLASDPHVASVTSRRLLLTAGLAAMLSVGIQTLRQQLEHSNARTAELLRREEDLNAAARELTLLSDPPAITALGTKLAARMAMPEGGESLQATYLHIEGDMVVIDAEVDRSGTRLTRTWNLNEHPGMEEAIRTLRPVAGPLDPDLAGPVVREVLETTGLKHGVWVPVCPDGTLHGVLALGSRSGPVPDQCIERAVALGHLLELALSNWAAHENLEQHATAEERRRIARELHDGLAHELAFIASKTRGWSGGRPVTIDVRELSGAADRALDEARRAITVLSVPEPQSLDCAIAQTAEDLGSRFGIAVDLELAADVDVPGEIIENVLRIVREALTNAAMHGHSARVRVRLEQDDGLRLVIEDDGCGFDAANRAASSGFGLLSMQERAARVGADFSVDSSPSRGTRVEVAFR
jgi:signal transduction histidine kinase